MKRCLSCIRLTLGVHRLPDDLLQEMLPFLNVPSLLAFAKLSPVYDRWVITHLDVSLDNALRTFVNDPRAFRSLMRLLGAVLSGSFALSFLARDDSCKFTPNDLDLYLPRKYVRRFALYLVEVEGYALLEKRKAPYGMAHHIVIALGKGSSRIELIPSTSESALLPIANFWSTHVMNYISADTFCVAYPELTFNNRGVLSPVRLIDLRHTSSHIITLIQKYAARGFDIRTRRYAWDEAWPPSPCTSDASCPRQRRFFGDRFCVTGTLSRNYEDCGFSRALPSELTVLWWGGGDACGVECDFGGRLPERAIPSAVTVEESSIPGGL